MNSQKAPEHLRPNTAAWFEEVTSSYELEAHHVRLLTLASQAWDRAEQARQVLDAEGLTYVSRFNEPRARPEVAIERDSRIAFARLLRELSLDIEPPPEAKRPPRFP